MLVSVIQAQVFFLALTRVLAILAQIPMLGGPAIPVQVRIAFGLVLTAILVPFQPLPANAESMQLLTFAAAIFRELVVGLIAGFAANLTFASVQIAAELMSTGAGFSSGRILNPLLGESASALDQMFVMFTLTLFLVINGHHVFIAALQRTFDVIPVGGDLPPFYAEALVRMTTQLIALGIQMALPVLGTMLLTDLALGLLARVAPQVQVFFLGLPAKIALGLMILSVTLAILLPSLAESLGAIGPQMLKLLGS